MISGPPSAPPCNCFATAVRFPIDQWDEPRKRAVKNDNGIRGLKSVKLRWSIRLLTIKKPPFPIYSIIEHFYLFYSTDIIGGSRFNQHYTNIIYHHI